MPTWDDGADHCAVCKGRKTITCPDCQGSGKTSCFCGGKPDCGACHGSGRADCIPEVTCTSCGGAG
jgi:hypothetical protein